MLSLTLLTSAYLVSHPLPQCHSTAVSSQRAAASSISMINLFGNTEESRKVRDSLSLRQARAGDRKVSFRKQNAATKGLTLGLVFRESFGKAVFIDKIIPGSQADTLKKQGKIKEGDEIVMVSATFGNEMWSARNIGKQRLEKSIAVRQGMFVEFVVESPTDNSLMSRKKANDAAVAEAKKMSRLQAQLTAEVEAENKKGKFLGLF